MGAPFGNRNAANAKRWQQAINRALARRSKAEGIEELDRLAEKFLDAVEEMTVPTEKRGPSIAGFIELADRIDGKSDQHVSISGIRAEELNDDELSNIAAGSRDRTTETQSGAQEPSSIH